MDWDGLPERGRVSHFTMGAGIGFDPGTGIVNGERGGKESPSPPSVCYDKIPQNLKKYLMKLLFLSCGSQLMTRIIQIFSSWTLNRSCKKSKNNSKKSKNTCKIFHILEGGWCSCVVSFWFEFNMHIKLRT